MGHNSKLSCLDKCRGLGTSAFHDFGFSVECISDFAQLDFAETSGVHFAMVFEQIIHFAGIGYNPSKTLLMFSLLFRKG